jgi:hypothetical protein
MNLDTFDRQDVTALSVISSDNPGAIDLPILRTFAQARPVRVLSGLAELSFVAGRAGDDAFDWAIEADDALIDAFRFEKISRADWLTTAKAALTRAFDAGAAQRKIDNAEKSPTPHSLTVARAHAVIYRDEIGHPSETRPAAIDSAVGYVAKKLAERHPLTSAEAAYVAMQAFEDEGLIPSLHVAHWALDRAEAGCAERLAVERLAEMRAEAAHNAASRIFGA